MMKPKANHLFEVSWEVCNKVGGIWTVVMSKVGPTISNYGDNYCLIGPYFADKARGEFQESLPPDSYRQAIENLKKEGIFCHFGHWLVSGEPKTILIEFSGFSSRKNDIKKELYDLYKIDSLYSAYEFEEPVIWSYAAGMLLEQLAPNLNGKIVAQFHEWLSGAGLLYLKARKSPIATVFTTHATMLGRTLTGNGVDLYKEMPNLNPGKLCYDFKVNDKHQMETACAQNADAFTTVSEITGIEAEGLLRKKPDILLPNGLDMEKFPTYEDCSVKHYLFRDKIREFCLHYFLPYYYIDLEQSLNFFIASRYEFHDKGIDVFIDALANLNQQLKEENSKKTVIAFFFIPAGATAIKTEVLENKTRYQDIKDTVDESLKFITQRLLYTIVSEKPIDEDYLLGTDTKQEYRRKVLALKRKSGTPPICTHDLYNEANDPILKSLKAHNLTNKEEDRVKVVFYPIYLSGADRLLDLNYYESMMGSHLGVFPSYYEPFGYTPLEAGALAVPSLTTDCAGFGRFLLKESTAITNYPGIYMLKRLGKGYDEVVASLSRILHDFCSLTRQERAENKIQAKKLANLFDWKLLIENYIRAHNLAIEKRGL
jgi:glycogen(starch) synthase